MSDMHRRQILRLLAAAPLAAIASTARAATHDVIIKGFAFEPASLQVNAGDKVRSINEDGAQHTATAEDGSFDTGPLGRNASAEITINAAGQHPYFCALHPRMKGVIIAA